MSAAAPDGAIDASVVVARADGDLPEGVARLEDALEDGAAMPDVEIAPDDNFSILYTSGTTGHPKGALSSHRAVLSALLSFAARGAVQEVMEPSTDTDDGDEAQQSAFMLCVPLFHVTESHGVYSPTLAKFGPPAKKTGGSFSLHPRSLRARSRCQGRPQPLQG